MKPTPSQSRTESNGYEEVTPQSLDLQNWGFIIFSFVSYPKHSQLRLLNTTTASLHRDKTPPLNNCSGYNIKQSDGEVPTYEIWGMQIIFSLPLLLVRSTLTPEW